MLVLCRKQNEEIFIGEDVSITIIEVSGNRVRIGITAPDAVTIRRAEITFRDDTDVALNASHSFRSLGKSPSDGNPSRQRSRRRCPTRSNQL